MAIYENDVLTTLVNENDSAGHEGYTYCTVMKTAQEPSSTATDLVNQKDSAGYEGYTYCTIM
jgi:hypothetical protein